jgi:hypothetical protein
MKFPVMVCVVGAAASFWATIWLRKFKVREKPPASRSHLSSEERQQKIRIAGWIAFGMGCVYAIGAVILALLK